MSDEPVYLDHNATTPVHEVVREAMVPWLGAMHGNPSSGHLYGRRAAQAVAQARAQVAGLIGCDAGEVVFTSGGTEADNWVLRGAEVARKRLLISAVEHPAIEQPAAAMGEQDWEVQRLPVDGRGVLDLDRSEALLAAPAGLVSVILAQNETGVVQPVTEVVRRAKRAASDVLVHTDAAQAVGKIEVDVRELGVDMATVVSHKLYGPCGIGAVFVRRGVTLEPLLLGGGQEGGLRPGTEPVALIVGLGAACALAASDLQDEAARQRELKERLWSKLADVPGIVRTAADVQTLPNTLHVCFAGRSGAEILARAPAVAASTGSACHDDGVTVSGVLGAMGLEPERARGAVRLTLGRSTTQADIDRAAAALVEAATM